jgi:hypothetical protein
MLLMFYNGTYVTTLTRKSNPEDVDRAAVTAAQLLCKKLQVRAGVWVTSVVVGACVVISCIMVACVV